MLNVKHQPNRLVTMRIVEAEERQRDHVMQVERHAFVGEEVPRLVADLLQDSTARPSLSLLAYEGPRPVGHALFTKATLSGTSKDVPSRILAPLAVVPEFQRRGIGRVLIERGVEILAESGVKLVFVLGHPGYYPRCGFEPATPHGLLAPYPIEPEEAWMVRALDSGVLGAVRGTVACAKAMDRPEHWRE